MRVQCGCEEHKVHNSLHYHLQYLDTKIKIQNVKNKNAINKYSHLRITWINQKRNSLIPEWNEICIAGVQNPQISKGKNKNEKIMA